MLDERDRGTRGGIAEMIFGKERTRGQRGKNRELGADIKARQTIRRDADAIVLRLVDRRSIVSSRSAHSILLSRSPEYSYLVISGEHPSKVARSLARTEGFIVIRNLPGYDTCAARVHTHASSRVRVGAHEKIR